MKRTNSLLLICFLLMSTVTPSHALFNNDVKKAKEFVQVGMVPQAVTLLEKRITEKPTDGEAHFLLGTLYIKQGELGSAEQRFKSAVMIDSSFGFKIGGEYKKEGLSALGKEQYGRADRLLNTAVQYQSDLGKEIGGDYFTAGKVAFSTGDKNTADKLLKKALKFDHPAYTLNVKALYQDYARGLLETAKSKPKNQRKRYINEASQYLPKSEIDAVFPPPYMKVVFQKQFTGIGYTGGKYGKDLIVILTIGENVEKGNEVIIKGKNVKAWHDRALRPTNKAGHYSFINKGRTKGDDLAAQAPEGEVFTVTVKTLTSSY